MTEAVNQHFKELMHKKLSRTPDSKAVVGWFFEDATSVATHGDFGFGNPETMSFQIGSITKLFTATLSSVFHDNGTLDLKGLVGDYLQLHPASTINASLWASRIYG